MGHPTLQKFNYDLSLRWKYIQRNHMEISRGSPGRNKNAKSIIRIERI